jgi:ClpP class serine protease
MSGGTLIALAADKIVMDKNAILGPVDPQLTVNGKSFPAVSLIKLKQLKGWDKIDDQTVVAIDQAQKAIEQVKTMVSFLLGGPRERIDRIVKRLVSGETTHDYPLFYEEAKRLGLPVSTEMPEIVYEIMEAYLKKN